MSRMSSDELAPDGTVLNGFDYALQVWVEGGIAQNCAHPDRMRLWAIRPCCGANRYAGQRIADIPGHEVRG